MVALQIISKVLQTQDISLLEENQITKDYFPEYQDEIEFILKHYNDYGNVPDKATFIAQFPEFELVEVQESDRYLVDTIREEYLYYKSVPVVQQVAKLMKTDSNAAVEYMIQSMKDLQPNYSITGVDIIQDALNRYEQFTQVKEHQNEWFFTTGFEELDDLIHGIQRGEELFVLFARTNQGKSWVLEKICTHVWQLGFNVGYVSPEMSANSIGYRFDTLYNQFSNKGLMWGNEDADKYKDYIEKLKDNKHKFIVSTPMDFNRQITVSKLKQWVKKYKLDMIAIDGITYMSDERYKRGDNKTTSLTNISEDLMELSIELKIPVLVVVQANRNGVSAEDSNDVPELESIRDSDGIAHNASKVLSIKQTKEGTLTMQVKKQRFGAVGGKLIYQWGIDTGEFVNIPSYDDAQPKEVTEKKVRKARAQFVDKEDVF
jgi:replicative DNA helicase